MLFPSIEVGFEDPELLSSFQSILFGNEISSLRYP